MYLVDTHVALWVVAAPERLGQQTRTLLAEAPRVFVSAISVLELVIKDRNGRIVVPTDLARSFEEQGLVVLPLLGAHSWISTSRGSTTPAVEQRGGSLPPPGITQD